MDKYARIFVDDGRLKVEVVAGEKKTVVDVDPVIFELRLNLLPYAGSYVGMAQMVVKAPEVNRHVVYRANGIPILLVE